MGNDLETIVTLDVHEKPELKEWGEIAKLLSVEWLPRINNLISSKGFVVPGHVKLILKNSSEGIAGTDGAKIEVSSHWIEQHPDDLGLVVHELTHVVQSYPHFEPGWITEGIADYVRWGIYEGKPLTWYPINNKTNGYLDGYRVTAGFFLWLEKDLAPGIVRILNTHMRNETYKDSLFFNVTGLELDELWTNYLQMKKR